MVKDNCVFSISLFTQPFLPTLITIHILKAYDESYSKIIRGHKCKDKDNDKYNDKDKDTHKVPENPTYAIFLKS